MLAQAEITAMQAELEAVAADSAGMAVDLLDEALVVLVGMEEDISLSDHFAVGHHERERTKRKEMHSQLVFLLTQQESAMELVDIHRGHASKLQEHYVNKFTEVGKQHCAAANIQALYRRWKARAHAKHVRKAFAQRLGG